MQKYSVEWVKEQAEGKTRLDHHDCSICGENVGYIIQGEFVEFDGNCGCVSYRWPARPSSFEEIAQFLQAQSSDEIRDRIMSRLK